jgi:hypothetical protein
MISALRTLPKILVYRVVNSGFPQFSRLAYISLGIFT